MPLIILGLLYDLVPKIEFLVPFYIFLGISIYLYLVLIFAGLFYRIYGPIKEGVFKLNSKEVFPWVLSSFILRIAKLIHNLGVPNEVLLNTLSKIFKTKLRPLICSGDVEYSLVEIDDSAIIGLDAKVLGHIIEGDKIYIKKVRIGKKAIIGTGAIIFPGCEIGEKVIVGAGSVVPKNRVLEKNSVYVGIPARKKY